MSTITRPTTSLDLPAPGTVPAPATSRDVSARQGADGRTDRRFDDHLDRAIERNADDRNADDRAATARRDDARRSDAGSLHRSERMRVQRSDRRDTSLGDTSSDTSADASSDAETGRLDTDTSAASSDQPTDDGVDSSTDSTDVVVAAVVPAIVSPAVAPTPMTDTPSLAAAGSVGDPVAVGVADVSTNGATGASMQQPGVTTDLAATEGDASTGAAAGTASDPLAAATPTTAAAGTSSVTGTASTAGAGTSGAQITVTFAGHVILGPVMSFTVII